MKILFSFLSTAAAAFAVFVGFWVLLKNSKPRLNQIFLLICLSAAYWAYSEAQLRQTGSYESAVFWLKFGSFWPIPIAFLLHFVLVFTEERRLLRNPLTYLLMYVPVVTMSIIDLTTDKVSGYPVQRYWGWTFETSANYFSTFATANLLALGGLAVFFCWRYYFRQTKPDAKKRARLVALGFSIPGVAVAAGEMIYVAAPATVPEFEVFLFSTLGLGLITHAIRKYQLLNVSPAIAADKIVSTMSDALFIVSRAGTVVYVNEAATRLLGYEPGEIVGKPCQMIRADAGDGNLCTMNGIALDALEEETSMRDREGNTIPVSLSRTQLKDKKGRLQGCLCIARDISRRKQAERVLLKQREKLAARNEALSILYDIASAISLESELDKLLGQALDMITGLQLFNVEKKGGIFLIDDDRMRLVTHRGHDQEFVLLHEGMKVSDECLCSLAARTGEIIISINSNEDSRHGFSYEGMQPHGHVVVPLKSGRDVTGVLYLYLPPGKKPADEELRLLHAIGNQIGVAIKRARLYEATRSLSLHDALTGLANRNLMGDELKKGFARARRTGEPCALIMLDLDHFKTYNDAYGHAAGDRLLMELARILLTEIREMDMAARYGGEEFLLILPDTGKQEASDVCERIRKRVEEYRFDDSYKRPPTMITISLGLAVFEADAATENVVLDRADTALYLAKSKGRNRTEIWSPTLAT